MHGEREDKNCGQNVTSGYAKREVEGNNVALLEKIITFGLNIVIAVGSNFITFEEVMNHKIQKAGELPQFCIAGWISMPVLYSSSNSLFQIKHCCTEIKNCY